VLRQALGLATTTDDDAPAEADSDGGERHADCALFEAGAGGGAGVWGRVWARGSQSSLHHAITTLNNNRTQPNHTPPPHNKNHSTFNKNPNKTKTKQGSCGTTSRRSTCSTRDVIEGGRRGSPAVALALPLSCPLSTAARLPLSTAALSPSFFLSLSLSSPQALKAGRSLSFPALSLSLFPELKHCAMLQGAHTIVCLFVAPRFFW
jgi:hypothetical protein